MLLAWASAERDAQRLLLAIADYGHLHGLAGPGPKRGVCDQLVRAPDRRVADPNDRQERSWSAPRSAPLACSRVAPSGAQSPASRSGATRLDMRIRTCHP